MTKYPKTQGNFHTTMSTNFHLRLSLPLFLPVLVLLSGCGSESTGGGGEPPALQPVTEIRISGNDQMRFAPATFAVKAGTNITLTLENIGTMPKEAMGHNLVIIKPGIGINVFSTASQGHPGKRYIAPEYADQVVASTDLLGPGEKTTVTFTAPAQPGDYPFACTFPGHAMAGMKGVMKVLP
jgi:azurin